MSWLKPSGPQKKFRVLFTAHSGREYMIDLTQVGLVDDEPPFVATEIEDGVIEAGGSRFGSLEQLALNFGCLLGEFISVDPAN